jgi:hypothetical protein
VRKAGNQVRIAAQLVDTRTDTQLWSETWDRTLDDIFAVQEEIAAEVVERLQVSLLGGAPRVASTDPKAYALFPQSRQLGRQRTAEGFQKAVEVLEQAIAIEPEYAPAIAHLGLVSMAHDGDLAAAARYY